MMEHSPDVHTQENLNFPQQKSIHFHQIPHHHSYQKQETGPLWTVLFQVLPRCCESAEGQQSLSGNDFESSRIFSSLTWYHHRLTFPAEFL